MMASPTKVSFVETGIRGGSGSVILRFHGSSSVSHRQQTYTVKHLESCTNWHGIEARPHPTANGPGDRHRMDLHLTFANGTLAGDGDDDAGR
jgi:hypothetical protein